MKTKHIRIQLEFQTYDELVKALAEISGQAKSGAEFGLDKSKRWFQEYVNKSQPINENVKSNRIVQTFDSKMNLKKRKI